ncbi:MAG: NAD(P)H-binding protein [Myxococcota bacterium]
MKVILFGATGMVGQGALRACLQDPGVTSVLAVVRSPLGQTHAKLRELIHKDFTDYSAVEKELAGYDACFYCLGVSSAGMSEADYHRVTYDYAMAAAQVLVRLNPGMTFIFVSGAGTDSTEQGRSMWARVKGKTENALLRMPFKSAVMFRPGYIHPVGGVVSRTPLYRAFYVVTGPLFPLWKALFPRFVTTNAHIGRAMIRVAREGSPQRVLESHDIDTLGAA